jgi:uncharacterized protein (UPF0332 family)
MLHGTKALLLTQGLEPLTHGGVAHYLSLHFVRKGAFPVRMARIFTRLHAEREAADYDRAALFTAEAAGEILALAGEYVEACRKSLSELGFPPQ